MWFLMTVLDSVWASIVHLMVLVGVAGYIASIFIKNIPFLVQYNLPIRIGCGILFVLGVFFEGSLYNEKVWKERVAALEEQVKISEQQSASANLEIEKLLAEKKEVVKEVQIVVKDRIIKQAVQMDSVCVVGPEVISILNDAARNRK